MIVICRYAQPVGPGSAAPMARRSGMTSKKKGGRFSRKEGRPFIVVIPARAGTQPPTGETAPAGEALPWTG